MSMPFYVSPEQLMKDRADFARKGIARGRSVAVVQYADGIVFVSENPSQALHKVSEIYDRIAFAAVGRYNEFENLRIAGVRLADMRGYAYDRRDVTGRGLANAYAQTLGTIFSSGGEKPYEVEIFVAEVGDTAEDDQVYRLTYDGQVADEHGFAVMGGNAELAAAYLKEHYAPGAGLDDTIRLAVDALGRDDGENRAHPRLRARGRRRSTGPAPSSGSSSGSRSPSWAGSWASPATAAPTAALPPTAAPTRRPRDGGPEGGGHPSTDPTPPDDPADPTDTISSQPPAGEPHHRRARAPGRPTRRPLTDRWSSPTARWSSPSRPGGRACRPHPHADPPPVVEPTPVVEPVETRQPPADRTLAETAPGGRARARWSSPSRPGNHPPTAHLEPKLPGGTQNPPPVVEPVETTQPEDILSLGRERPRPQSHRSDPWQHGLAVHSHPCPSPTSCDVATAPSTSEAHSTSTAG